MLSKTIKREIEVAFSKHAQPVWFRICKYAILIVLIFLFWKEKLFWTILFFFFIFSLLLHFWYRYKTKGWTMSYGGWKYEKNLPKKE
jgi:hypothetical protein